MSSFIYNIKPPGRFTAGLKELWQYRELFYFFTWRDIKVRYKQTSLGILWALIQPLAMMALFTLLFSKGWSINTGALPYPIFVLSGLILWGLFHSAVSHASESIIQHSAIIRKIYFPRLIIPGSAVLVAFFDFIMGFLAFLIFCIIYQQSFSWQAMILFPAGILLVLITATGAGILLAGLTAKYRDFRYTVPFLLQFLFFATQVIYPIHQIRQPWLKTILSFNPVSAAIELFRAPLFHTAPDWTLVLQGTAVSIVLLFTGIYFFRKTEVYFADLA